MLLNLMEYTEVKECEIALCKPSKEIIGYITDYMDLSMTKKLKDLDEISFNIPKFVDIKGKKIINPIYENVLGDFLLLVNNEEYYVIDSCPEDSSNMSKEIHAYSYEYLLKNYKLRSWKGTRPLWIKGVDNNEDSPEDQRSFLGLFKNECIGWNVGHIDDAVLYSNVQNTLKYRYFDIAEKSWLSFLKEDICESFNCLIVFDTLNKIINLYDRDNYGEHKGLYLSDKDLLQSIKKDIKYDTLVTRLRLYGKDNLSIQGVNPTGFDYIEDYSYYKNEKYMDSSLISKLNNYEQLIIAKEDELKTQLSSLNTLNTTLIQKQEDMSKLEIDKNVKQRELDLAQRTENNSLYATLIVEFRAIETQIVNKKSEINNINGQISTVNTNIGNIRKSLDKKTHFTDVELEVLQNLVRENTWSDETYIDVNELYADGKKEIAKYNKPEIDFDIDIVNFLQLIEYQYNWDKLVLGDIVTIDNDELNICEDVRILEYTHNISSGDLSLVISNKLERKDATTTTGNILKDSNNNVNITNQNKHNWNTALSTKEQILQMLDNDLNVARNRIISEYSKIIIDERGILSESLTNPNRKLRISGDTIGFTDNDFDTVKTAISSDGIYGEFILANSIKAVSIDVSTLKVGGDGGIQLAPGAVITWDKINKTDGAFNNDVVTITQDTITAPFIKTLNLEVGNEIKMSANATISWENVTNQPTIPSQYNDAMALYAWASSGYATQITSNGVYTGQIYARQINAGEIQGCTIKTANTTNFVHMQNQWLDIYHGGNRTMALGSLYNNGTKIPVFALGSEIPTGTDDISQWNYQSPDKLGLIYRDDVSGRMIIKNKKGLILESDNITFSGQTNIVPKFA